MKNRLFRLAEIRRRRMIRICGAVSGRAAGPVKEVWKLCCKFWCALLFGNNGSEGLTHYERALADFRHDKLCRIASGAAIGLSLAHYLDMPNTCLIGIFPCVFMLGMERFTFKRLFALCGVLEGGVVAGILVMEVFQSMPYMAALITFGLFVWLLKLFARMVAVTYAYLFTFTYCLSSINASYADSTMEMAATEYFLIQLVLIFFIVWGCFACFPAVKPDLRIKQPPLPPRTLIPSGEQLLYALIFLAIWLFFQLFEWKFALFAFLSFIGVFRGNQRMLMKDRIRSNIRAHVVSCGAAALFSLLLFSFFNNFLIFLFGIMVLLAPFFYFAVYVPPGVPAYRYNTMLSGVMVPLTLYIGIDHAAVYQSSLRAWLIVAMMVILYFILETVYRLKYLARFTRRQLPNIWS